MEACSEPPITRIHLLKVLQRELRRFPGSGTSQFLNLSSQLHGKMHASVDAVSQCVHWKACSLASKTAFLRPRRLAKAVHDEISRCTVRFTPQYS
eukprot:scaffold280759_cov39-Prasinocladus_malaysianus.AAC.1